MDQLAGSLFGSFSDFVSDLCAALRAMHGDDRFHPARDEQPVLDCFRDRIYDHGWVFCGTDGFPDRNLASVGDLYLVDRDRPGAVGSGGMACLQAIQAGRWRVEAGQCGCERLNGSNDHY